MKIPLFAVDVGYGNTKFAYRIAREPVATGMFRSLAPLAPARTLSAYCKGVLPARNVATITLDRIEYEVGPDVPITAAYGMTGRTLTEDYALTDQYAALLFGAIHFAGVTHIEHLVLGLPVCSMHKYSPVLKNRFIGEFEFGHGRVVVDKVSVLPLLLGSLVVASSGRANGFRRDETHAVIDVGYFTTDWAYTKGFTMDESRSGGMDVGTSQICRQIAKLISRDEGEVVDELERIDKALHEMTPFLFYGKDINLAPYADLAVRSFADILTDTLNDVGLLRDVRSVLLSGGGASLYAMAIRRAFPLVAIETFDSPCMANVRGLLIGAEAVLARKRRMAG